eukprot:g43666.t1
MMRSAVELYEKCSHASLNVRTNSSCLLTKLLVLRTNVRNHVRAAPDLLLTIWVFIGPLMMALEPGMLVHSTVKESIWPVMSVLVFCPGHVREGKIGGRNLEVLLNQMVQSYNIFFPEHQHMRPHHQTVPACSEIATRLEMSLSMIVL